MEGLGGLEVVLLHTLQPGPAGSGGGVSAGGPTLTRSGTSLGSAACYWPSGARGLAVTRAQRRVHKQRVAGAVADRRQGVNFYVH